MLQRLHGSLVSTRALLTSWHLVFATIPLPASVSICISQSLPVAVYVYNSVSSHRLSFLYAFLEFVSNLSVSQPLLSPSVGLWAIARWPETSDEGGCVGSVRNTGSKGTVRPQTPIDSTRIDLKTVECKALPISWSRGGCE